MRRRKRDSGSAEAVTSDQTINARFEVIQADFGLRFMEAPAFA